VIGLALEPLAAVIFTFFQQHKQQLWDWKRDASHALLAVGVWAAAWFVADQLYGLYKAWA
jgi:hypothetical protein